MNSRAERREAKSVTFPHVVGLPVLEAKVIIESAYTDLWVQIMRPGDPCYENFCATRVQVFVNKDDIVNEVPYNS